jgi:polar amino acid transport system substrate-binding protein
VFVMRARRNVLISMTAALAAGAMAVSGCSSSSKSSVSSTPAGGGGSSSSTASGVDAASAALVPAAIKSKGVLTFAMDATYPPDESVAADGKTIIGMDADLAADLATLLGLKVSLVNATFDTIIPGLQDGKYDVGLSSFTDTKAREKVVDFVTYFQAGEGYYVKAGSSKTFEGLDALCGAKVAVESGTTEQSDAQTQAKACTAAGKPTVTVLTFSDQNAANLAVSSGRADVGFVDSQVAGYIVKQSNGQFALTGTAFEVAPYGIALPKGNGMSAAVLSAVKALIANGTYTTLLTKWGVQSGAITAPVINGATS